MPAACLLRAHCVPAACPLLTTTALCACAYVVRTAASYVPQAAGGVRGREAQPLRRHAGPPPPTSPTCTYTYTCTWQATVTVEADSLDYFAPVTRAVLDEARRLLPLTTAY